MLFAQFVNVTKKQNTKTQSTQCLEITAKLYKCSNLGKCKNTGTDKHHVFWIILLNFFVFTINKKM